jgi:ABC-2 type transport system ATP-binding protein
LTKVFNGKIRAVDEISFNVEKGEILGFLGPNGAGKTTTLNMLATLQRPTSGTATVNGHDIIKEPDEVRHSVGFVFQDPTLDTELTGRENLDFHGRIYGLKRDVRQKRIEEVLELVQLKDRENDLVKTYSGGMKRRLEIGRGLLHHPQVLFLDEPTLGLDPQTRSSIWEHIQHLNREKIITIILTTHYTEEADRLCNRILIIDFGKIVVLDTPENLKARLQGDIVSLTFKDSAMIAKVKPLLEKEQWIRRIDIVAGDNGHETMGRVIDAMRGMGGVGEMMPGMPVGSANRGKMPIYPQANSIQGLHRNKDIEGREQGAKRLNLLVDDGGHRIPEIVKLIDITGVVLDRAELHKPTLDDVFLSVTGRNIRDEQGSFMEMIRRRLIVRQARGRARARA